MEAFVLQNGRVRLSAPNHGDIADITKYCATDPELIRWTTIPHPYTEKSAIWFIDEYTKKGWADDTCYVWAIRRPTLAGEPEGPILGTVDLQGINAVSTGQGSATLGYAAYPPGRGLGLLTEAARLVLSWALDPDGLNLARVAWSANAGNWRSRRVAWKLGFQFDGTIRARILARNPSDPREDEWVATLLRGEPLHPNEPWPTDAPAFG
ncbi:MAG: GNAT family N-acetyltransferase [Cellulomonadaceae bacterium]|nr:GNAT family N-acetyltransferase [Cellulomonadaceae bacterium]